MHEMSIAQEIIRILDDLAQDYPDQSISRVHLHIGVLASVIPDSLLFCFDSIKPGTPFAHAELLIETLDVRARCVSCEKDFCIQEFDFSCPYCQSTALEITQGKELCIAKLELIS